MISVVVITRNRTRLLAQCLESLDKQTVDRYEIVLVDDGSSDKERKALHNLASGRKHVRVFLQKHSGRGAARNLGISKAQGEIIAFTDDDCIVPSDWLAHIVAAFAENPGVSAIGGPILNLDHNPYGEACHLLNFSAWLPSRHNRAVRDVPTANAAYKLADIQSVRFPDSVLDIDYEDSVFNESLLEAGKTILFVPDVRVGHQPGIWTYAELLANQRRKGLSFLLRGYALHGTVGRILAHQRALNLLCPRLIYVFLRSANTSRGLWKFVEYFPILWRGEFERALTILRWDGSRGVQPSI